MTVFQSTHPQGVRRYLYADAMIKERNKGVKHE